MGAWDLSATVFGSFGAKIYDGQRDFYVFRDFSTNVVKDRLTNSFCVTGDAGCSTPGDQNAKYPRLNQNDNTSGDISSFYVQNGTYVRLRTLQIGWTAPPSLFPWLPSGRIYLQAENLFTITGYPGLDPSLPARAFTAASGHVRNHATNGNWGCGDSNWPFGSITRGGAYKGSEAWDQPEATKLELYVWSSDQAQDYLDRKWASMYEGVVRANSTIRLLQKVSKLKPGEIVHADSMSIMGEALFLRAHYHFEAWRMWGNIPYYYETDNDFRKANLSSDSAAKLVIADLNAAAALLPTTPRNGQVGRATSWGARAYKGRGLVFPPQYPAALPTMHHVLTPR